MKSLKMKHAGFTMVEVIAVLVILAIAAAVAIARSPSLNTFQVSPEAEVIKGHLRYAQTQAMDTSTVWGITFASGSYTLFNSTTGSNPLVPGISSATATLPAGMTITTGTVSFDTWGTPYTDAGATVVQNAGGYKGFSLTMGTASVTIQIRDDTGFIP
ncbi:MAG TPA: GspH/FimT family pseudopilin [Syntrophobacteraceae bacterium]|nr:GspH/FimT family pseudopilin [Syntrophobacteraceae bacterium]